MSYEQLKILVKQEIASRNNARGQIIHLLKEAIKSGMVAQTDRDPYLELVDFVVLVQRARTVSDFNRVLDAFTYLVDEYVLHQRASKAVNILDSEIKVIEDKRKEIRDA